ncbi:vascular cell adhesion protein 1 isoform X2 [Sarcophilus harrisii]|uniref:Vascular cell adhesion molecule 1 n=1 Tax=Sarcophilus harrisii TaxID=9305 RepID=G3W454_SARHA|nr:vascular cell adhesion protein 1 isoform X2 [Sarcophilus harrisii]
MRGQKLRTVLATNFLWMVFVASEELTIEVGPSFNIAAEIGGSTTLTCNVTGCEAPLFSWRAQIDTPLGGKVQNQGTKSVLTIDPVGLENENYYLCIASCGNNKVERGIQVKVYSFPRDPEIEMSGPLIVGIPVTVTCKIPKVYPSEQMEIAFLKNGSEQAPDMESHDAMEENKESYLETKSLKMTFTPTMEDMGKSLTCEAKLFFHDMEFEFKEKKTTQILQVNTVPQNATILITPSSSVQEKDSVTMTCFSEGLPLPQIFWSKKQDGEDLLLLSENAMLTLVDMRKEDSGTYVCEAKNQFGTSRKEVEVIVETPLTMEISPGPKIDAQIGDSLVLTCTTMGCDAPLFSWKTLIDSPLLGQVYSEGNKSTLIMNSIGLENEHFYVCTASCGDKKVEKVVQVKLYSFPRNPEIEMSGPVIIGSPVTVTCKVPEVYPSELLEMSFWKEDSQHHVELHNINENVEENNLETKSLKITFTPTMEDMGRSLICEAKLPIDEMEFEPKERRTIQILQVNIPPKDTRLTAFPSDSVKEGDSVTISCTSGNVPKSQIILRKKTEMEDKKFESDTYVIRAAQLEDAGVYECESKNEGGSEVKSLTLDVKVPPRNTTISIHPSRTVLEGENVTITCKTFSHPPAVIVLKKIDMDNEVTMCSKNGTFTLYHVTPDDTGVYIIDVSNEVGNDSGQIEISVMEIPKYFSPQLLALYCLSSLIIPATGMVIYFARKANHKGSYSLVDALKSKV